MKKDTIGKKIKAKRKKLKLNLEKAASKAEISISDLENLEKDNYNELPAEIYVKSILKRLSKVLKLDGDKLYKQYREKNIKNTVKREMQSNPFVNKKRREVSSTLYITPKVIITGLIIILIIFLGYYFVRQASILFSPPLLVIDSPDKDFETDQKNVSISGQTEADVNLRINGNEATVGNDGNFSKEITLSEGLNLIKIEAESNLHKITTEILRIVYKPSNEIEEPESKDKTISEDEKDEIRITIRALTSVTVYNITIDGSETKVVMLKDDIKEYSSNKDIKLTLDSGSKVELTYNDSPAFVFPTEEAPDELSILFETPEKEEDKINEEEEKDNDNNEENNSSQ